MDLKWTTENTFCGALFLFTTGVSCLKENSLVWIAVYWNRNFSRFWSVFHDVTDQLPLTDQVIQYPQGPHRLLSFTVQTVWNLHSEAGIKRVYIAQFL